MVTEKQHLLDEKERIIQEKDVRLLEKDAMMQKCERLSDHLLNDKESRIILLTAQLLSSRGTLSRRALFELTLEHLKTEIVGHVQQQGLQLKNPSRTELDNYLFTLAATSPPTLSAFPRLATAVTCYCKSQAQAGLFSRLSSDIHGAGWNSTELTVKPPTMAQEDHDLLMCLATHVMNLW